MIMVAWITAAFYRSEYTNILFLNTTFLENPTDIQQRLLDTSIFSKVILIHDEKDIHVENLITQVCDTPEEIAYYHFSSYGSFYSTQLFNFCQSHAIAIILNEEGGGTYTLYESYYDFFHTYTNGQLAWVDLDYLSEIWVFNPALYGSQSPHKLREINFWSFISSVEKRAHFVDQLNHVFNYHDSSFSYDAILLTQNFYAYKTLSLYEQLDFYAEILHHLKLNIAVKPHPCEAKMDYTKKGFNVIDTAPSIPWEIIMLNRCLKSNTNTLVLISVLSTALYTHRSFFHRSPYGVVSISLYKIAPEAIQKVIGDKRFNIYYNLFNPFDECHFPINITDLKSLLQVP